MLFALLLCLAVDGAVTEIAPEIYEPLRRYEVVMSPDGSIYLTHFNKKVIMHYNADGELVNTFGRKGNGPGEFQFPFYLSLVDDKIIVNDLSQRAHHLFDLKGNFLGMHKLADMGLNVVKVKNGWIGASLAAPNPKIPIATYRFNETLGDKQEINSWPRPQGANMALMVKQNSNGKPTIPWNPVRDRPLFKADRNGKYLYLYFPDGFHIKVLDGETGEVVNTIKRKLEPIPFDEDYGNSRLNEFKEENKGMAARVNFEANFPDHFPLIRDIFISPDNHLGVRRWSAKDLKEGTILVIDKDGKNVTTPYPEQLARRILFLHKDHAWLNVYDPEDEEAVLMKVPLDKLAKVAAENTYDSSAEKPRPMIKTN